MVSLRSHRKVKTKEYVEINTSVNMVSQTRQACQSLRHDRAPKMK